MFGAFTGGFMADFLLVVALGLLLCTFAILIAAKSGTGHSGTRPAEEGRGETPVRAWEQTGIAAPAQTSLMNAVQAVLEIKDHSIRTMRLAGIWRSLNAIAHAPGGKAARSWLVRRPAAGELAKAVGLAGSDDVDTVLRRSGLDWRVFESASIAATGVLNNGKLTVLDVQLNRNDQPSVASSLIAAARVIAEPPHPDKPGQ